jgi:hypothetical protein
LSITQRLCEKTINQQPHNSGAARAYGCLSTSFSRLEKDTRHRGAFSLYWDSKAFALSYSFSLLDIFKWIVTEFDPAINAFQRNEHP